MLLALAAPFLALVFRASVLVLAPSEVPTKHVLPVKHCQGFQTPQYNFQKQVRGSMRNALYCVLIGLQAAIFHSIKLHLSRY